jgi:hypothetical protein
LYWKCAAQAGSAHGNRYAKDEDIAGMSTQRKAQDKAGRAMQLNRRLRTGCGPLVRPLNILHKKCSNNAFALKFCVE